MEVARCSSAAASSSLAVQQTRSIIASNGASRFPNRTAAKHSNLRISRQQAPAPWRCQPSAHRLRVSPAASSSSSGALSPDSPLAPQTPDSTQPDSISSGSSNVARNTILGTAVASVACLAAAVAAAGGPANLLAAISKSGFTAAFSLIFVSEIGDKTFFIAALLAMRHPQWLVLAGSVSALGIMSVISAAIGRLFREVPAQLHTTIPVGEYLACALLVWFGLSSIRSALAQPSHTHSHAAAGDITAATTAKNGEGEGEGEEEEGSELAEARETVEKAEAEQPAADSALAVFWKAFSLVFLAEWGDRSMLATIALGAAQSPVGVALGATVGHLLATGLAIVGGSLLSQYISERAIGLTGGILFLAFAAASAFGIL